MSWNVEIGDEFDPEFDELREDAQTEILALAKLLQQFGPGSDAPHRHLERFKPREHEGTAL